MDAIKKILNCIQKGDKIAIRPVNKSKEEIVMELLVHFSGVNTDVLKRGAFNAGQWSDIMKATSMLKKSEIYFLDNNENCEIDCIAV
jgi:replicative DNA helicase